ncbi:glutaminase [Microbacterium telephonicum]|uniref:Glutaminase n=1 Tax=Microbacterium telephonicum TaxID=1714841 RepID=A0A498C793_9MICO|nr:glutaminase [Microbacterium telephonicum]RLK48101.1 hypothetical protein C7474_2704 [Microbacterium telephonicum]
MTATLPDLLDAARARLAGSPTERLGVTASSRRLLGFGRAPRIVPVGDAWHVGVLLIGADAVFATGGILRAREEAIRGYTADAQRARAELAAAAFRGGFAEGETVHVDWQQIDPDAVAAGGRSGPLLMQDDVPSVVWNAAGGIRPLADYLDDQLSLR